VSRVRNETVVTVVTDMGAATAGSEACLVVLYGDDLGRKYTLDAPTILIGRSNKSDIQIDEESVSRNHAKIIVGSSSVIIRDLHSTNGTYVNDEYIDERVLRDGDLIKIGRTIFKFLSGGNVENAYHEEIYRLTTMDGLTQVYNKRYSMELLEREMSRARRYGRALSIIMFDIDHFKNINDTCGHLAGDYVLRHLASVVRTHLRREDAVGRYGGEEFLVILPEVDLEGARLVAEKIRRIVETTTFRFDDMNIPVTVSLGVATLGEETRTVEEFLKVADERLYEAKQGGRNRACG